MIVKCIEHDDNALYKNKLLLLLLKETKFIEEVDLITCETGSIKKSIEGKLSITISNACM